MKQKLLDELMKVSEEEQKYRDGQGNIERQLYVNEKLEEIDRGTAASQRTAYYSTSA